MESKTSQLKQRVIVGLIATTIALLSIYSSFYAYGLLFIFLVVSVTVVALIEFYDMSMKKGIHPDKKAGVICSAIYIAILSFASQSGVTETIQPLLLLTLFFLSFASSFGKKNTIVNLSVTLFGFIYIAVPLSFLANINYFFQNSVAQDGRWWLIYLLFVTKMTDVGAFFCGKCFGINKLAPFISPGKTREGALGGFLVGTLSSVVYTQIFSLFPIRSYFYLPIWQSILLGIILSIAAEYGDLAESLLKRDANVKDSSYLPGFGGILDMVDSLLFTAPIIYVFLLFTQKGI